MMRRRQINARRRAPRLRALRAAAGERARGAFLVLEDRVAWPAADRMRGALEAVRWPLERVAWGAERAVVWPLGDRVAGLGVPSRALAGAAAMLAVVAIAAGAILAEGGGSGGGVVVAAPEVPPVKRTAEKTQPPAPVLRGAVPDFTPEDGERVAPKIASAETAGVGDAAATPSSAGSSASTSASKSSSAAAKASSADAKTKVADPGPAAIEVARRFSDAFVLYETGRSDAKVRAAIGATASPRLRKALLRRPPRLPANVEVPKAKVLNVVPGPRRGDTFTLSASLLRVGVTSELRIDVRRDKDSGEWQVTDILG